MTDFLSSFIIHQFSFLISDSAFRIPHSTSSFTSGVVPVLVEPLQVLIVILPGLLVALGGFIFALLKPSAMKKGLRLLWRMKLTVLVVAAVAAGSVHAIRRVLPELWRARGGVSQQKEASRDWPMFRGNPGRSGTVGDHPEPTQGSVQWSEMDGHVVAGQNLVADDRRRLARLLRHRRERLHMRRQVALACDRVKRAGGSRCLPRRFCLTRA